MNIAKMYINCNTQGSDIGLKARTGKSWATEDIGERLYVGVV